VEGRKYVDFLSAYSAVNQGHAHPRILRALTDQASRLSLCSRAFYNDVYVQYAEKITRMFGYDMVLPMNTGAEAVETSLKVARKWGYDVKHIPHDEAIIISVSNNFHGRTLAIISMSNDPDARGGFGPYMPRVGNMCTSPKSKLGDKDRVVTYDNVEAVERALKQHGKHVAAILVEPVQGEAGVVVPKRGYLTALRKLCSEHNVLLIVDEIQTGLGRTGRMLACMWEDVRPDMVLLGKALSGGVYPVSAVLADASVMGVLHPGQHGSTYGGNPLACAVAMAALDVLVDEKLSERAEKLGTVLRDALGAIKNPKIQLVRGLGLLNAVVIDESMCPKGINAWHICLLLASRGVLAKPTHGNIIRLAPPLVITEEQILNCVAIFEKVLVDIDAIPINEIPLIDL
jgi:ornithine--oxo-acid transaminase